MGSENEVNNMEYKLEYKQNPYINKKPEEEKNPDDINIIKKEKNNSNNVYNIQKEEKNSNNINIIPKEENSSNNINNIPKEEKNSNNINIIPKEDKNSNNFNIIPKEDKNSYNYNIIPKEEKNSNNIEEKKSNNINIIEKEEKNSKSINSIKKEDKISNDIDSIKNSEKISSKKNSIKDSEKISERLNNIKREEIKIDESLNKSKEIIISKIKVKIKLEVVGDEFWEKDYNKETQLNIIASEFKEANNLEKIKRNHFIEFTYNNEPIQMDSRTLDSIINEGDFEIIFEQKIKKIPGIEFNEKIEPVDFIGKPISNPFEIYIFDVRKQIIEKIKFKNDKKYGLGKYGIKSAYCNGINHLFISGGEDINSNNALDFFWDIDLKNKKFNEKIIRMPIPKKNHKMIYIDNKVYIIGGNDTATMFYDMKNNKIIEWAKLKKDKFEPSLIKYNTFLFCFESLANDYYFEKIDLTEQIPEWEIVKPQINPNIFKSPYSQKFFGLIEDKNENIIFIGGIDNESYNKGYFNLKYNVEDNLIEKSNLKLNDFDNNNLLLSEKTFLPIDENTYILFPDFNKREPKILYFYKDRNSLEIKTYQSKPKLTQMLNKTKIISLRETIKDCKFDMPTISKNKNIYVNENKFNNFDFEHCGLAPEYVNYLKYKTNNDNYNNNYEKESIILENNSIKNDSIDNKINEKNISSGNGNRFRINFKNKNTNKDFNSKKINENLNISDKARIEENNNYIISNRNINNISKNNDKNSSSLNDQNFKKEEIEKVDSNIEREKELDMQRKKEEEEQKLKELEIQKQKEEEEQRLKELELQKQKEEEEQRLKELEMQKQKEEEEQRLKELEMQKQKEEEEQRLKELEMQKQKDEEEQRLKELEMQKQKEEEEQKIKELEIQKQKEEEEQKIKELEIQKQKEEEEQKLKELEIQKQKEEEGKKLKELEIKKEKEEEKESERDEGKDKNKNKDTKGEKEVDKNEKKIINKIKSIDKNSTSIEKFDNDKVYSLMTFHSSVNNDKSFEKLQNNKVVKQITKMNYYNIQPKDVSIKLLKKERRKFKNYEFNEFIDDYNNY